VTLLALPFLAACGSNGVQQVANMDEVLVRTATSVQGQAALSRAGAEVASPLSCTSSQVDGGVSVSCTGTTVDGKAVQLTGTATSLPGGNAVKGNFVATVDGQQVLTSDCLGCS